MTIHFSAAFIHNFSSRVGPCEISPPTSECQDRHIGEIHGYSFPVTNTNTTLQQTPCPSRSYNLSASSSIMFPEPWAWELSCRYISVDWASHVYYLLHFDQLLPMVTSIFLASVGIVHYMFTPKDLELTSTNERRYSICLFWVTLVHAFCPFTCKFH